MKKSFITFITFWKDFWELQKATNELSKAFLNKHWKGFLVFEAATFATGCMLPCAIEKVKKILSKLRKKNLKRRSPN